MSRFALLIFLQNLEYRDDDTVTGGIVKIKREALIQLIYSACQHRTALECAVESEFLSRCVLSGADELSTEPLQKKRAERWTGLVVEKNGGRHNLDSRFSRRVVLILLCCCVCCNNVALLLFHRQSSQLSVSGEWYTCNVDSISLQLIPWVVPSSTLLATHVRCCVIFSLMSADFFFVII